MRSELDLEKLEQEEHSYAGEWSPDEIEAVVTLQRLELYNKGDACGPKALRKRLAEHYQLRPLPSERTIARILAKQRLSGGRTGHYPGDESVGTFWFRRSALGPPVQGSTPEPEHCR